MKFGVFYELQPPRPTKPESELNLYQNAPTQIEVADRCRFDYAWEAEHHFLVENCHSPQPAACLAAASRRTKNIRLGHGIIQPTANPVRPSVR